MPPIADQGIAASDRHDLATFETASTESEADHQPITGPVAALKFGKFRPAETQSA